MTLFFSYFLCLFISGDFCADVVVVQQFGLMANFHVLLLGCVTPLSFFSMPDLGHSYASFDAISAPAAVSQRPFILLTNLLKIVPQLGTKYVYFL